jgi:rhamnulokinase
MAGQGSFGRTPIVRDERDATAIAVDLGSSGGRIYVGTLAGGRLKIEDVDRFGSAPVRIGQSWYWDLLHIWARVQEGLARAAARSGATSITIGVDSFGVDYALLGPDGRLFAPMRCMRDPRTQGLFARVYDVIPSAELYRRTGTMEMPINTLVQLVADRLEQPWLLREAGTLLFAADLITYCLSGRPVSEVTLASTSQFFDPRTRAWREDVLESLDLPTRILAPLVEPGTLIAPVQPDLRARLGLPTQTQVVAVASHDTAAAFAATPLRADVSAAVISLGTWSLFGLERTAPNLSEDSQRANFSNECGVQGRIVYHKILMGLWLVQECLRVWRAANGGLDFAALHRAADEAPALCFVFDPNDPGFIAPDDMPTRIAGWFEDRRRAAPVGIGAIVRSIYESLALSYRQALERLETLEGARFTQVHIVGGGAQAPLLCQAVSNAIGRPVLAGPAEATALGNVLSQFVATGAMSDFAEGRALVAHSFPPVIYEPRERAAWEAAWQGFLQQRD